MSTCPPVTKMDGGLGSRMSRASSRYGSSASAFSGPVRRWKKRWVHVSPPPTSVYHHHHHHSSRSYDDAASGNASRLLLCRWTPLSSTDADFISEEPPKRKFRYMPVVSVVDEQKEVSKKVDESESCQPTQSSIAIPTSKGETLFGQSNIRHQIEITQPSDEKQPHRQDSYVDYMNSGLCLNK